MLIPLITHPGQVGQEPGVLLNGRDADAGGCVRDQQLRQQLSAGRRDVRRNLGQTERQWVFRERQGEGGG